MRKLVFFSLVLLGSAWTGAAQSLVEFVDSYAKSNQFNGTVLVHAQGKVQFQQSYGLANLTFKVPNSNLTKFKIASITKLFTAVLVMQLQERGKLDIDKAIGQYLPEYKGEGKDGVTLRQLLRHTSGIQNMDTATSLETVLKEGMPVYQLPATVDQSLETYCSGPLVNKPGEVFDYNNADFVILGKIIEKLCGKPYGEALRDNVLNSLGMENSGLLDQKQIVEGLADTYFYREDLKRLTPDLPVYPENWHASGSMYSTAGDLLKFAMALFGAKLVKKESLDQMFDSQLGEYGFGTWVYKDYAIRNKLHTLVKRPGRIMGAQSVFLHVLDTDVTVIVLSNVEKTNVDRFGAEILERVKLE